MLTRIPRSVLLGAAALGLGLMTIQRHTAAETPVVPSEALKVAHRTVKIDGLDIFYRQAGPKDAPTILLLHGFPTSSHMFRHLIPALADEFHLVAPDYPGFGYSSAPPVDTFDYTFNTLADVVEKFTEQVGLTKYTLYVQDYGGRSAIA
jgi:pimeloyl-ACP methyl ester carboxylesterase